MGLLTSSGDAVGGTKTQFPNLDLMFSPPPLTGLIAFQVKSWSSRAETEQFEANIGIMGVTPTAVSISTNKVVGASPISGWSNVPLYDGLGAAVTQSTVTTTTETNVVGNNDPNAGRPTTPWTCTH